MIAVGICSIIRSVASSPFILGISMSIVMTSGLSDNATPTPSAPSLAAPTTSTSPLSSSICLMTRRMKAESSIIRTLILDKSFSSSVHESALDGCKKAGHIEYQDDIAVSGYAGSGNALCALQVLAHRLHHYLFLAVKPVHEYAEVLLADTDYDYILPLGLRRRRAARHKAPEPYYRVCFVSYVSYFPALDAFYLIGRHPYILDDIRQRYSVNFSASLDRKRLYYRERKREPEGYPRALAHLGIYRYSAVYPGDIGLG